MIVRFIVFILVWFGAFSFHSNAQATTPHNEKCFDVRVKLNGRILDGPSHITLLGKEARIEIERSQGCFHVPSDLLKQETLDLTFIIGKDELYMTGIQTFRLETLLDVEIEDKKFYHESLIPKGAQTKQVCYVVYKEGEPEIASIFSRCRKTVK
jgi:hypothetical protein